MDSCGCVVTPASITVSTVTSAVVYDGSSLPCLSFSGGNVNDLALVIAQAICTLQSAIASISINTNGAVLIGINTNCLSLTDGETLTTALNAMLTKICANATAIADLNSNEVITANITTIPNCFGITDGMTLTQVINLIVSVVCTRLNPTKVPLYPAFVDPSSFLSIWDANMYGAYNPPLSPYVKSTFSYTDTSSGGTAKVTLPALDYYTDGRTVVQASEQISLTSNSDNYIYLDNTNGWVYNVSPVAIGNPTPTTTGSIICKVTTGTGTVTSVTQLIARYPISNDLLQNSSVKARNLYSDVVNTSGAIIQDGNGALENNVDGTTIQISSNKLALKTVYKANIDSSVAGSGLKQNVDLSLSPNVGNSVTNNAGAIQLVNDASSGINQDYGFNASGVLGYHDKEVLSVEIQIPHLSILTLHSVPLLVIPAPGVGKTIQIISCAIRTETGWTTPYATNTDLYLKTLTSADQQVKDVLALTSTIARAYIAPLTTVTGVDDTQLISNKAIYVQVDNGDPTGGASGQILDLLITYKIW